MVSRAPTPAEIETPARTHDSALKLRPLRILGDMVIFVMASAVLAGFIWMVFSS
jgi:hypothetical protein